jgi:hypothetical protein
MGTLLLTRDDILAPAKATGTMSCVSSVVSVSQSATRHRPARSTVTHLPSFEPPNRSFGGAYHLHVQGRKTAEKETRLQQMAGQNSDSETSVHMWTTRCYNPEDGNMQPICNFHNHFCLTHYTTAHYSSTQSFGGWGGLFCQTISVRNNLES